MKTITVVVYHIYVIYHILHVYCLLRCKIPCHQISRYEIWVASLPINWQVSLQKCQVSEKKYGKLTPNSWLRNLHNTPMHTNGFQPATLVNGVQFSRALNCESHQYSIIRNSPTYNRYVSINTMTQYSQVGFQLNIAPKTTFQYYTAKNR